MIEPKIVVANGTLTITLPLKAALKERRPSTSDKSLLLTSVSTRLDTEECGMIRVGLNVFQKNPAFGVTVRPTV